MTNPLAILRQESGSSHPGEAVIRQCGSATATNRGSSDAARCSLASTRINASSLKRKISANIVTIHFLSVWICLAVGLRLTARAFHVYPSSYAWRNGCAMALPPLNGKLT